MAASATTVIEQVFHRTSSRGVSLWVSTTAIPAINTTTKQPSDLSTWLGAFVEVAGVTSIDVSNDRNDIDLNELDTQPTTLVGTEIPETFYHKVRIPGDKEAGPFSCTLNMNQVQFANFYNKYLQDEIFGFFMNFPRGSSNAQFIIGIGCVKSIDINIDNGKIIENPVELQPAFGVQYLSNCESLSGLKSYFMNYLGDLACPA